MQRRLDAYKTMPTMLTMLGCLILLNCFEIENSKELCGGVGGVDICIIYIYIYMRVYMGVNIYTLIHANVKVRGDKFW